MNHSPGEVKRKFGIPHSMLYKWQREQIRMVPTGIFADKVKVTHYPYLNKLVSILPKPADCNSTTTTKTSPSRSSVCSPSIARSPSSHDNVKYQEKVKNMQKNAIYKLGLSTKLGHDPVTSSTSTMKLSC